MNSKITLVPYGGLCNRMRCIAGAYTIALKYGVNLQVWWRSNKECKIDFEQLFEPLSLPRIQVSPMKLRQIELFKSRWINLNIPSTSNISDVTNDINNLSGVNSVSTNGFELKTGFIKNSKCFFVKRFNIV